MVAAPGDLSTVLAHLRRMRGLNCEAYKETCLRRRVAVRMRAVRAKTYEEYADVLAADPTEFDRLLDALTINVSSFYRNPDVWDIVEQRCLPDIMRGQSSMHLLSAPCAAGEEPYTLAMLALEAGTGSRLAPTVRIDAVDLDQPCLDRADAGRYSQAAVRDLPPRLRDAYGRMDGSFFQVGQQARDAVTFFRRDLIDDAPPAPTYDLVTCRNLLIYLDRPTQLAVLRLLADHLRPGGFLVLGKVESLPAELQSDFEVLATRQRIFRRL